jgi:NADH-quinone oxidoreductase subunit E
MLVEKYPEEVKKILAKYPPGQKRSAVMPLLYLAQRSDGYVMKSAMEEIASLLEITSTEVAQVVGFYTLYSDKPVGRFRIQVCTDLPCALRGADKFLQEVCENLGIQVGETTPDGMVTVEAVKCLAACNGVPMFQIQSNDGITYHENMSVEKTLGLIETLKKSAGEGK